MIDKKAPLRMCVACRGMLEKKRLIRVVKNKNGEIQPDVTGKMPGRGAYVCREGECLAKAAKGRRLERAFSAQMPAGMYESLNELAGAAP